MKYSNNKSFVDYSRIGNQSNIYIDFKDNKK